MIDVNARHFGAAMKMLGQCVERRNTLPILGAVHARVNGCMELTGTDLDMTMRVGIPYAPADGGKAREDSFMIENFRDVARAVGAGGNRQVRFAHDRRPDKGGLRIESGALAIAASPNCHADDFPLSGVGMAEVACEAILSPAQFRAIGRVFPAISAGESRHYLNGVYLHHEQDWTWRAVATDGHRLMVQSLSLPGMPPIVGGIILPRKAMRVAMDVFRDGEHPVTLKIGAGIRRNAVESTAPNADDLHRFSFDAGVGPLAVRIEAKAIDGRYPDYGRVIPTLPPHHVMMPLSLLRQAILAVFWKGSRTPAIRITLPEKGKMIVSAAHAPEGLSLTFRCDVDHDAPAGFIIGFNALYLLECLNVLKGGTVSIGLTDGAAPTVFRDPEDGDFLTVIMPMRV